MDEIPQLSACFGLKRNKNWGSLNCTFLLSLFQRVYVSDSLHECTSRYSGIVLFILYYNSGKYALDKCVASGKCPRGY